MRLCIAVLLAVVFAAGAVWAEPRPASKHLRIASDGAHPPFNFVDDLGRLQGFEIDIANAVCARMKARCDFMRQDFVGIIPGLIAGRYDMAFSSLSMTEQRRAVVDFSDKYYETAVMLVANKKNAGIDVSPEGMRGRTLGVRTGTTSARYAQDVFAPAGVVIKQYMTQDEARLDLAAGRVDLVIGDKTALLYWMEKSPESVCCQAVGSDLRDPKYFGDGIGAAVRKGDVALKAAIDQALGEIRSSGEYDRIRARYFPYDVY